MTRNTWRAASVSHRCHDIVRTFVLSIALWILYVPHSSILRLLGPRLGMGWVWLAAHAHWASSFIGIQQSARLSIKSLHPYFDARISTSEILRRHLLLKHACF